MTDLSLWPRPADVPAWTARGVKPGAHLWLWGHWSPRWYPFRTRVVARDAQTATVVTDHPTTYSPLHDSDTYVINLRTGRADSGEAAFRADPYDQTREVAAWDAAHERLARRAADRERYALALTCQQRYP